MNMNLFDDPMVVSLMIFLGALFFMLAYKKPLWAVAGVLFCLPTYLIRASFGGLPFNLLDVLIVSTFFGVGFRTSFALTWQKWFKACGLFVAAGVLGVLVSPATADAIGQFKSVVIEPVILFLLLVNVVKNPDDRRLVVNTLLLSGAVLALVTIVQYFWGYGIPDPWQALADRRSTAWFGYPNAIGLYLAPIFALAVGQLLLFGRQKLLKFDFLLALITTLLIPAAVATAHTDGAVIAIGGTIVFFGWFTKKRWWFVGIAVLGLVGVLSLPVTRDILLFRDVSGDVRLALWTGTWRLIEARAFAGSGLAGFPYWYNIYRNASHVELLNYSHNILFDFWLQMTVMGLIAWTWIEYRFFTLLKPMTKVLSEPWQLIFAGMMVSELIYGLVDVPYFKNDLAVLFWTIIALAVLTRKWTKSPKNATLK